MTEYGPEIRTDRQRPEWIRDDDLLAYLHTDVRGWIENTRPSAWMDPRDGFRLIEAIRLPADHPYYLATSKGFAYWPGGDVMPEDREPGSQALFRSGEQTFGSACGYNWQWAKRSGRDERYDIIGYHRKVEDIVQIKRMTESEALEFANKAAFDGMGHAAPCYAASGAHAALKALGLVKSEPAPVVPDRYVKVEDVEEAHRRLFEGGNLSLSSLDAALRQLPVKELSDA